MWWRFLALPVDIRRIAILADLIVEMGWCWGLGISHEFFIFFCSGNRLDRKRCFDLEEFT